MGLFFQCSARFKIVVIPGWFSFTPAQCHHFEESQLKAVHQREDLIPLLYSIFVQDKTGSDKPENALILSLEEAGRGLGHTWSAVVVTQDLILHSRIPGQVGTFVFPSWRFVWDVGVCFAFTRVQGDHLAVRIPYQHLSLPKNDGAVSFDLSMDKVTLACQDHRSA